VSDKSTAVASCAGNRVQIRIKNRDEMIRFIEQAYAL